MSDEDIYRPLDPNVIEDVDEEIKEPEMYKVLLHNDHYTTMVFVIEVLQKVFHKAIIEATKIMLDVHRKGIGVVGVYSYDVARTKTLQVHSMAREREFPLQCSFEKA